MASSLFYDILEANLKPPRRLTAGEESVKIPSLHIAMKVRFITTSTSTIHCYQQTFGPLSLSRVSKFVCDGGGDHEDPLHFISTNLENYFTTLIGIGFFGVGKTLS